MSAHLRQLIVGMGLGTQTSLKLSALSHQRIDLHSTKAARIVSLGRSRLTRLTTRMENSAAQDAALLTSRRCSRRDIAHSFEIDDNSFFAWSTCRLHVLAAPTADQCRAAERVECAASVALRAFGAHVALLCSAHRICGSLLDIQRDRL